MPQLPAFFSGAQKPQLHCAYLDEFSHGRTFRRLETTSRDGCSSSEPNYRQELMTGPWGCLFGDVY